MNTTALETIVTNTLPQPLENEEPNQQLTKSQKEVNSDYKFSRKTYRELIKKGSDALDKVVDVADESGHPRAYEVLAMLLKNVADTTDKLMMLQESRSKILPDQFATRNTGPVTNNNLFIGSTAELQEFIENKRKVNQQ